MNCFNRTNISAGTAVGADIGVDFIDITFGDSFNRTLINAGSASGAVVRNNVSHFLGEFKINDANISSILIGGGIKLNIKRVLVAVQARFGPITNSKPLHWFV
jgi:hypothetical protein